MKYLSVIFLLLLSGGVFAQHVANTFQAVERTDISMQKLDAVYPPAVATDTAKAVFKGAAINGFVQAYTRMQQELGSYLTAKSFKWDKPTKIFTRVYFAADGSINYYLVNLAGSGLTDNQQKIFLNLLNKFIANHKINYTAGNRFAQCSPLLFKKN